MMQRQASAALIRTWIRLDHTPSICKLARSRLMAHPSPAAPWRLIPRRTSLIPRILRSPQTISISWTNNALHRESCGSAIWPAGDSGHGFLNFASRFRYGWQHHRRTLRRRNYRLRYSGKSWHSPLAPFLILWATCGSASRRAVRSFASTSRAPLLKPALAHATSSLFLLPPSTRNQTVSPLSVMISGERTALRHSSLRTRTQRAWFLHTAFAPPPADVINVLGAARWVLPRLP